MEPHTIVYAEDNHGMRTVTRQVLEMLGFDVHDHDNGKKALDDAKHLQQEGKPFWVLTDHEMPEMDGIGLLRGLSDAGIRVPTMMLTATEDIDRVLNNAGVRDKVDLLCAKPFGLEELRAGMKALATIAGQEGAVGISANPKGRGEATQRM